MSKLKKAGCKTRSRALSWAGFLAPFALALAGWIGTADQGMAQGAGLDLQQGLRGLGNNPGGLSGGVNGNTNGAGSSGQQNQVLQPQQVPQNPRPLPTSRLEQILSARAGMRLQQFGYDQLGNGQQVSVPETGAVQDDYILGPGDEVMVSLRGQENSDVRTVVDRNGRVVLPRLAPIPAAGRNFGSFRQDVDALVRRAYVASTASVAIARVRQISVLVSGEVNIPGPRLVTGLSSAVDAILLSGGIRKTGSLRNLRIRRGSQEYSVDLYSVLTGGGRGGNMRLADGDRVIVPPLGPTVAVAGLVRRPGIYELPPRSNSITAQMLLNLAGGQEVRGRYRLSVQRIEADGRLNLVPLPEQGGLVRDSEILRVELGADLVGAQATLSGGIGLAGQYAVGVNARLSDVVRAPGALGTSPYTLFGIIVRKDPRTLMRSLVAFTPAAVLGGTEDMPLQSDDVIRPITVNEAQLLNFVVKTYLEKLEWDQRRIRDPLQPGPSQTAVTTSSNNSNSNNTSTNVSATFSPSAPETPRAITLDNPFGLQQDSTQTFAAGQGDFRAGVPAEMQRANVLALMELAAPGTPLFLQREQTYQRALLQASQTTSTVPGVANAAPVISPTQMQRGAMLAASQIGPNDVVRNDIYTAQPAVPQMGNQFDQNGQQTQGQPRPNLPPNQNVPANFQEQPVTGDNYATNQEVYTFGALTRQLGVDPLVLVNFLIDHSARLDGAVRGPGSYFVGPGASLSDLVQAAGGTVSWADESGVELMTTLVDGRTGRGASQRQTLPLRQGTLASYVVRPRDQFHFNQVFSDTGIGTVSVQGEVRNGGNYPIRRGERLSEILMRAGGLTSTAYPQGTVFLRKSAARVEQAGYERAAKEIESQLLSGESTFGTTRADPGAVHLFAAQLRNQRALGRISMVADPSFLAANPGLDPLLEAGDVVYIPQRPSTITVLGEVMQPGSYAYQPGMTVADYVRRAGGHTQYSYDRLTFIVMPDGSARKVERSWLNFDAGQMPPGSTIVVPRDLQPFSVRQLALDLTTILSGFAITAASLAVLSKQ